MRLYPGFHRKGHTFFIVQILAGIFFLEINYNLMYMQQKCPKWQKYGWFRKIQVSLANQPHNIDQHNRKSVSDVTNILLSIRNPTGPTPNKDNVKKNISIIP